MGKMENEARIGGEATLDCPPSNSIGQSKKRLIVKRFCKAKAPPGGGAFRRGRGFRT